MSRRDEAPVISRSVPAEAGEILALQKRAFRTEADRYRCCDIQPLKQTLEELRVEYKTKVVLKAVVGQTIVGSVRGSQTGDLCWVEKLMVHPDFRKRGLGTALMGELERCFPTAARFGLSTAEKSEDNVRLYEKRGYVVVDRVVGDKDIAMVTMEKRIS
ncbi:MAG TPA: GNAT family N-acetyltransferase [Elusimicrobiota bacterium]|nr:GNAT family N-acetyltransferase [Elusimicrobiota bacterium]